MDSHTFQVAINHVREHDPDNEMLPVLEAMGYSPVAIAYLEAELDGLKVPEQKKVHPKPQELPELKPMTAKLNQLFIERAKLSNTFHDVTTDKQRAEISIKIGHVQDDIKHAMLAIDHFKVHGEFLPEESPVQLPENPFELAKKLEYNRQSISRARRNLEKLKKEGKSLARQQAGLDKLLEDERHIKAAIAAASV